MTVKDPTWAVAFAALAIVLGCPADRVDDLYEYLRPAPLPRMPHEAVEQMRQAIKQAVK